VEVRRGYFQFRPAAGSASQVTPGQLRDFGERYTAAWRSRDPQQVAAFFSPEASLAVNGEAPQHPIDVARAFMADFPDLHLAMDGVFDRDGRIEYHWTLTGTHSGTGAKVRISGFEQWIFGPDGLVLESQGHFDAADYRRQLSSARP